MAFILFAIIVSLTLLQRWVLRDKDPAKSTRSRRPQHGAVEVER